MARDSRVRSAVQAAGIAMVVASAGCVSATPDTPGNTLIEFTLALQLDEGDPGDVVCPALKPLGESPDGRLLATLAEHGSLQIENVQPGPDGEAVVTFSTQNMTLRHGADLWAAELIASDGRWLLCGIEPLTSTS